MFTFLCSCTSQCCGSNIQQTACLWVTKLEWVVFALLLNRLAVLNTRVQCGQANVRNTTPAADANELQSSQLLKQLRELVVGGA